MHPAHAARIAVEHAEGRFWYLRTWNVLKLLYGPVEARNVTALLAVTSPRCHVRLNVARALTIHRDGRQALAYRHLAIPRTVRTCIERYLDSGIVRGAKVGPFYANLTGDYAPVTVDTWIGRMFYPEAWQDAHAHARRSYVGRLSPAEFRNVQRVISDAAAILAWNPAEVQSALWHASMIAHGRTPVCMARALTESVLSPRY